jgi:hypothetical protein
VVGLPTRNISFVRYEENTSENQNWLGSVNNADGSMRIYSRLGKTDISPEKRIGTMYHEGVHTITAFDDKNDDFYGSKEVREEVKHYMKSVADQAVITGIPLNEYHASLLAALGKKEEDGGITIGRFYRETEAILSEMRATDTESLSLVQERQQAVYEFMQLLHDPSVEGYEFTRLASGTDSSDLVGVEKTLAILHRVESKAELEERFDKIRKFAKENPSPFIVEPN